MSLSAFGSGHLCCGLSWSMSSIGSIRLRLSCRFGLGHVSGRLRCLSRNAAAVIGWCWLLAVVLTAATIGAASSLESDGRCVVLLMARPVPRCFR